MLSVLRWEVNRSLCFVTFLSLSVMRTGTSRVARRLVRCQDRRDRRWNSNWLLLACSNSADGEFGLATALLVPMEATMEPLEATMEPLGARLGPSAARLGPSAAMSGPSAVTQSQTGTTT